MPADAVVEEPPPAERRQQSATPPAAANGAAAASASAAEIEQDRAYYADLPLGLLHPAVLDHGAGAGSPATAGRRRYLCYFMHRHLEFRLLEAQSAAELGLEGGHAARRGAGCGGDAVDRGPAVVWEKPFDSRVRL